MSAATVLSLPASVVGLPTTIPSPTSGVWHLGPLPLRAYALCILAGIVVAVWMTGRRLVDRGQLIMAKWLNPKLLSKFCD